MKYNRTEAKTKISNDNTPLGKPIEYIIQSCEEKTKNNNKSIVYTLEQTKNPTLIYIQSFSTSQLGLGAFFSFADTLGFTNDDLNPNELVGTSLTATSYEDKEEYIKLTNFKQI